MKLRFDPNPEFPASRVWTEDPSLASVAGMLDADLQTPASARRWAQKVKDVVSGKLSPFHGAGNGYLCDVAAETSEVSLNMDDDPATATVTTAELIASVEEWAAHLDSLSARK